MPIDQNLLLRANELLLKLHKKISDHENILYEANRNFIDGIATEIIVNGKALSMHDIAFNFHYLHYQGPQIQTFSSNGGLKAWHDLEVKKSLNIALEIIEKLEIPTNELIPRDIIQWMQT